MSLSWIILEQAELNIYDTHCFSHLNDADMEEVNQQNNNFYLILKCRDIL